MDKEEDLLDSLLAVAVEELDNIDNKNAKNNSTVPFSPNESLAPRTKLGNKTSNKVLKETDIFQFESNSKLPLHKKPLSIVHSGDTDSSDDEGNRNYEDLKYNEYGREIKSLINSSQSSALNTNAISSSHYGVPKNRVSTWKKNTISSSSNSPAISTPSAINNKPMFGKLPETENKLQDVFMDPIFGMRIINPLISSSLLMERMQGRLAVRYSDLPGHIFSGNLKDKDWVICGVVVTKSPPKTSTKGSQYSIWTLSDLKDDIKTFSLFMFSGAHTDLWKTAIGTVVGVLNPSIMDQKDGGKREVSLSVSNAQKIMVFGHSKDFGFCKSVKKNGDKCTAVVNLSRCEYCIYHIKQEYQKCSKRSELQANFAGQGLINLRNKVLGKNEVFYAGKSYTALPAQKSKKLEVKDHNILQNLSGMGSTSKPKIVSKNRKGVARHLDINPAQRARDLKLLEKLGGSTNLDSKTYFSGQRSDEVTLEDSKAVALSVINKLKTKKSDIEKHIIKTSQYDLKGDLFVNVENKKKFAGNISEEVSLEKSKNKAIEVISKLKAKSKNSEDIKGDLLKRTENQDLLSIGEIEDQLNIEELNYNDDESKLDSVSHCPSDDLKVSCLNNSSVQESTILRSPKGLGNTNVFIEKSKNVQSPKSLNNNIESFEKISPKLTDIEFNFTNNVGSRTLHSTPKSTPGKDSIKYHEHKSSFTLNSTNLKQIFPSGLSEPVNNSRKSLVNYNILQKNSEVFLSPNETNSSFTELTNSNERTFLDKTDNSPKLDLDGMSMGIPMLSAVGKGDFIDLTKPITSRHVDRAKINAIKFIQRNGPIKKVDPNSTKGGSKKRNIHSVLGLNNDDNNACINVNGQNGAKKSKLQDSEFISDRFKKMMAKTSKYAGLLEQHDDEEKEKYFRKLEVKEKMEEKMTNTHKVKCKAVRCLQCKYTSFSASDFCKNERHSLKVFDAMKRFYKCSNCQSRTVTLELVPTKPCNNCGSSKWEKTGMMKEKIALVQHNLSIRGGEQKFVNSVISDANLDLLVPDD